MHQGDQITPSITLDYLTLDDDDGDIWNGTPHGMEIVTGFVFGLHVQIVSSAQDGLLPMHFRVDSTREE